MKTNILTHRLAITIICLLSALSGLQAQEKSSKFAHVGFPEEIKFIGFDAHYGYAGNSRKIWRFSTKDFNPELLVDISDRGWFTEIQGLAGHGENLYYYINGDGVYRTTMGKDPQIIKPRDSSFVKNHEESYSGMNVDPTGKCLLLYGWRENAVVFDIENGLTPIAVFNDNVREAYWRDHILWAGCLDKVVANKRRGKSMNNQDFIYYGTNDQHDMIKFPVSDPGKLPNFGEDVIPIGAEGEVVKLIYNLGNDDLLLCVSTLHKAEIFKIDEREVTSVVKVNKPIHDLTAYGNKIFVKTIGGFAEIPYPYPAEQKMTVKRIMTDLIKPKLWPQHKPDPYEISSAYFMDYDKDGNLWIGYNRDLFVVYK